MEGKMKKIFIVFTAGLPFMVEAMQSMNIECGSFVYSSHYAPDGGMACHPPITKDRYRWSHRTFSQHESPKSSVTINKVVLPVTTIVNPAYEIPESLPRDLYDEETGNFTDDVGVNTAVEDNTLQSIHIPASIQLLDAYCFYQCRALEKVEFEKNSQLKKIGRGAFFSCISLKSITIPNSVQFLDKECFEECVNLKDVTFEPGSNLKQIGKWAFGFGSHLEFIIVWKDMDITPLRNYFGTRLNDLIYVVND
jgi:hypothetical protein